MLGTSTGCMPYPRPIFLSSALHFCIHLKLRLENNDNRKIPPIGASVTIQANI